MKKGLFLDLNDTIIEPVSGVPFTEYTQGWKFKKGILSRIKKYYNDEYNIIIVTNQAGIDEGYVPPMQFKRLIDEVVNSIKLVCNEYEDTVKEFEVKVYVADHQKHKGRKPSPYFANKAKSELNLDLQQCVMVGNATGLVRKKELLQVNGTIQDVVNGLKKDKDKILNTQPKTRLQEFMVNTLIRNLQEPNKEFEKHYENSYEIVEGSPTIIYEKVKDHSDSDKQFAVNSGMSYIDIDVFLNI